MLTITEACARLRVCRNTLRAMIHDGRIRAVNLNPDAKKPTWRIDPDSLPRPQLNPAALAAEINALDIERRLGL